MSSGPAHNAGSRIWEELHRSRANIFICADTAVNEEELQRNRSKRKDTVSWLKSICTLRRETDRKPINL